MPELQNAQYQEIMREYEKRQILNHDEEVRRKEEVFTKIPEYKHICELISHLSVNCAKERLNGGSGSLETLKQEISTLIDRKKELLIQHGYKEDYLEPIYKCKDCKDTGYIGNEKCHCLKQSIISQLYKQSNIKELLNKENFHNFSLELYREDFIDPATGKSAREVITEALNVAKDFISDFDKKFDNLFIYGDVGVGKTFLANCIAKEILAEGYSVLYFSAANFFNAIANGVFHKENPEAVYLYDKIYDTDLLLIDDLGTEFGNSFGASQLFSILNERLLTEKSTIISTNLSLKSLKDMYTERCFSRITSNYKMIKLIGNDLRIAKKLSEMKENR